MTFLNNQIQPYRIFATYFVLLLVFSALVFLQWPVIFGDTDTWYHLSGGRQFFEKGGIPDSSYFSFIEPEKTWENYYWLFQVILYKVYSWAGYEGLVVLRAMLLIGTIGLIFLLLLKEERTPNRLLYLGVVAVILVPLVPQRFLMIRPHMFSYLFIVGMFFVLEFRPRWVPLLPPLGLAWSNLHGAEYPVMVLICTAYLLDLFVQRWRQGTPLEKNQLLRGAMLALTAWTVMFTPAGFSLVMVPFQAGADTQQFIAEMRPITIDQFFDVHWQKFDLSGTSGANIVLIVAGLSVLRRLRSVKPGHLLMLVAGYYLLGRGRRFYWEAVLLALPALKRYPLVEDGNSTEGLARFGQVVLLLIFGVFPFIQLWTSPVKQRNFPLSMVGLPDGVTSFLQRINTGGRVFNNVGTAGYLHWKLYPTYRIYADLQMSIFSSEDIYRGMSFFKNAQVFRKMVDLYQPDFISASFSDKGFPDIVSQTGAPYQIVFFDDAEVLYAHRQKQRRVVDRYGFKVINPYALEGTNVSKLTSEQRALALKELERLDSLYPNVHIVNQTIAMIHNAEKDFSRGVIYGQHLIWQEPAKATGYVLKGDALMGQESWKEALVCFRAALETNDEETPSIYRKIWYAERKLENHTAAYEAARKSMSVFDISPSARDLYDFGLTALAAKDAHEARLAFRFAALRVSDEDRELAGKISEAQSWLNEDEPQSNPTPANPTR